VGPIPTVACQIIYLTITTAPLACHYLDAPWTVVEGLETLHLLNGHLARLF
jgi:hypothetical protein